MFDDRVTIATPEGVDLELVLAGLGSRFAATMLDLAIQFGSIIALTFLLGTAASDGGIVVATYLVLVFLVLFGYDIALETWNGGRTVGKLAAGIRVVRPGGETVGFLSSAIRNLVRIVDFLPAFYPVGMVTILATKRNQRLGDLAAGTYVVRDRRATVAAPPPTFSIPPSADAPWLAWDVSAVTADEITTVRGFLDRRHALAPEARARLGWELAGRLQPKVAGADPRAAPEAFLEAVVTAKSARG